ncbi:hypothetical protein ACI3EY_08055 [Ornithinimicrobium sp. LYQ92]|uniref:hypothetical protein n=1 Tax=Serinicoccus sp. LYQ92 TaxID=3378798 RepID=UPI003852361D
MFLVGTGAGALQLECATDVSATTVRGSSERVTLAGVRKMQVAPRSLRTVPVSWDARTPTELGSLLDLVEGVWGPGPFRFVTDLAAVTSVLLPREANLMPGFFTSSAAVEGGPVVLADGSLSPRSLLITDGIAYMGTPATLPVLPGSRVTVSTYAQGSGVLQLAAYAADKTRGSNLTASVAPEVPMAPVSATWSVPDDIHWITPGVSGFARVARPAVSFTDGPVGWSPGEGIVGVLTGMDRSALRAEPQQGRQHLSGSASIVELGSR